MPTKIIKFFQCQLRQKNLRKKTSTTTYLQRTCIYWRVFDSIPQSMTLCRVVIDTLIHAIQLSNYHRGEAIFHLKIIRYASHALIRSMISRARAISRLDGNVKEWEREGTELYALAESTQTQSVIERERAVKEWSLLMEIARWISLNEIRVKCSTAASSWSTWENHLQFHDEVCSRAREREIDVLQKLVIYDLRIELFFRVFPMMAQKKLTNKVNFNREEAINRVLNRSLCAERSDLKLITSKKITNSLWAPKWDHPSTLIPSH